MNDPFSMHHNVGAPGDPMEDVLSLQSLEQGDGATAQLTVGCAVTAVCGPTWGCGSTGWCGNTNSCGVTVVCESPVRRIAADQDL